jgi:hypothetical protein
LGPVSPNSTSMWRLVSGRKVTKSMH